jgi:hypothetical protein
MAAAKGEAKPAGAAGAKTAARAARLPATKDDGEAARRARAYLDLWERQLVHAALQMRAQPGARAPGR